MGKQKSKRDRVRTIERERRAERQEFCDVNRSGAGGKFARGTPTMPPRAHAPASRPEWTSEHEAQQIPSFIEARPPKAKDVLTFMSTLKAWAAEKFPKDERLLFEVDDLMKICQELPAESVAKLRPLVLGYRGPIGPLLILRHDLGIKEVFLPNRKLICRAHDCIKQILARLADAGLEHEFYNNRRNPQNARTTAA
jgi:hypothetical protein